MHHTSGKVYIIELDSTRGTWVDSLRLEKHRPLTLKDGFRRVCATVAPQPAERGAECRLARAGYASAKALRGCTPCASSPGAPLRCSECPISALRADLRCSPRSSAEAGGSGAGSAPPVRPSSKRPRETAPDDGRTVRASHILIKHAGSRRPSSFREPVVTRSKEEAIAALDVIAARLAAGEAFAALAEAESHCSSAKRGGDLGVFGRGKMQAPFEHAAFALQVGQLSGVVDTDSGVHLILRTE